MDLDLPAAPRSNRRSGQGIGEAEHRDLMRHAAVAAAGGRRRAASVGDPLQTFGLEIEFDGGDAAAIARDLERLGLASVDHQAAYHSHERRPGLWTVERDGSVNGEVVSPVLTDSPQTWRDVETVCAVIRLHGGHASQFTGGHVNVGVTSSHLGPVSMSRLAQLTRRHEDELVRLASTDIPGGAHRGAAAGYFGFQPLSRGMDELPVPTFSELRRVTVRSIVTHGLNKVSALNLLPAVVGPRPTRRVEYRLPNGSVDADVWRTNVMIVCSLVRAAARRPEVAEPDLDEVGTGQRRGDSGESQARALADDLRLDHAQRLALYTRHIETQWQAPLPTRAELDATREAIRHVAEAGAIRMSDRLAERDGTPLDQDSIGWLTRALWWGQFSALPRDRRALDVYDEWRTQPPPWAMVQALTAAELSSWEWFRHAGEGFMLDRRPRIEAGAALLTSFETDAGRPATPEERRWLDRSLSCEGFVLAPPSDEVEGAFRAWRAHPLPAPDEATRLRWSMDLDERALLSKHIDAEIRRLERRLARSQGHPPSEPERAWIEERVRGTWPWNPAPSEPVRSLIERWFDERLSRPAPIAASAGWSSLLDNRWQAEHGQESA